LDKKPSRLLVHFHGLPLLALPLFPLFASAVVVAHLPPTLAVVAS
jgi:hypothetical protein